MASENENSVDQGQAESPASAAREWPLLPFVLTLIALFVYFAFNTLQMTVERSNLASIKANQEAAIQEAQKIQAQFKTLIGKTSELAQQGHAGAKMVMEGLQSQGLGFAPDNGMPSKAEANPAK
jgi:hypothetical protein